MNWRARWIGWRVTIPAGKTPAVKNLAPAIGGLHREGINVDELLTDQQQAERVKSWLAHNGGAVVAGLVLGLGGLFGWNWWQGYQLEQAAAASAVYEQLIEAVRSQRPVRAAELEQELAGQFGGSPYVDQARLALAKLHMDRNQTDEAERYLALVVASPSNEPLGQIARLRLARVQLHRERYDEALATLERIDENSAFGARFHEARGDIYAAQGQVDAARAEYEAALGAVEPGLIDRGYVQVKLDNLGVSVSSSSATGSDSPSPAAGAADGSPAPSAP